MLQLDLLTADAVPFSGPAIKLELHSLQLILDEAKRLFLVAGLGPLLGVHILSLPVLDLNGDVVQLVTKTVVVHI